MEADEVEVFRFRGNGWPGPTHVKAKDGRVFERTYEGTWYDHSTPWKYDIQFRCKICPDAIGELGDIACPDGWVMRDGKPIHEEAAGVNILVARTARGEALVKDAAEAGVITLAPFDYAELDAMHPESFSPQARKRRASRCDQAGGIPSSTLHKLSSLGKSVQNGSAPADSWVFWHLTTRARRG